MQTVQQPTPGKAAQPSMYLILSASVSAATCHSAPIDVEQGGLEIRQM